VNLILFTSLSFLFQIKQSLNLKKKKNLENQHSNEHNCLDENFNKELEVFNQSWDQKIREYEENSRKMEEEMNVRHKNEMEALAKNLESAVSQNIKYPPEYLHLRRSEQNLSKQQRFKEAELVKQKRIQIEKDTMENAGKNKNDKFKGKLEKLAGKQLLEKQALRKKIEAGLDGLEKERKRGEENQVHKYRNRKLELGIQQKKEKLFSENENVMKKKTVTGKSPQKPQHLMKSTNEAFVAMNLNDKHSSISHKNENVDEVQSERENENQKEVANNENNEDNNNLSNDQLQQSV